MADGATMAWLHEHGEVFTSNMTDDGVLNIRVRLSESDHARYVARHG
jgi:GTP-binding protein HflX